jgi:hypothetical protein
MDLSEVALIYPGILEALSEHEGIGLLVGREAEETVIVGRAGTLWVGPAGQRLQGANPLASLSDPDQAARQVARLAHFPHAGDLILFGAWDDERVVCFEEQVSSHGGLGGPQDWPFILFPPGERLSARGIENAEQIYVHLARLYGTYE